MFLGEDPGGCGMGTFVLGAVCAIVGCVATVYGLGFVASRI